MKLTLAAIFLACLTFAQADEKKKKPPVWIDAEKAATEHPAFNLLGEYELKDNTYALVAPLKDGTFLFTFYPSSGLPGRGWDGKNARSVVVDKAYVEKTLKGSKRITYVSPTMGKKAPENATATMSDGFTNVKDGILWA
ncbi:MAG: hypothetical protein AB8F34_03490, partial [Akkermansiaceae bacterium]